MGNSGQQASGPLRTLLPWTCQPEAFLHGKEISLYLVYASLVGMAWARPSQTDGCVLLPIFVIALITLLQKGKWRLREVKTLLGSHSWKW